MPTVRIMPTMISMAVACLGLTAIFPEERHEPQPEHIKRCDERRNHSNQPVSPTRLIGVPENLVFAEEAREPRNAGNGQRRRGHAPERPRNLRPQPAHLAHIL